MIKDQNQGQGEQGGAGGAGGLGGQGGQGGLGGFKKSEIYRSMFFLPISESD